MKTQTEKLTNQQKEMILAKHKLTHFISKGVMIWVSSDDENRTVLATVIPVKYRKMNDEQWLMFVDGLRTNQHKGKIIEVDGKILKIITWETKRQLEFFGVDNCVNHMKRAGYDFHITAVEYSSTKKHLVYGYENGSFVYSGIKG